MDDVIERVAARVLLIDGAGRVLLFAGGDPARPEVGTWWFTPGGGVEAGESLVEAARREIREETWHVLPADLGPVIFRRTAHFSFEGTQYAQAEHYFRVPVAHARVDYSGWTEVEQRAMITHRWWTPAELNATTDTVYPAELLELIRR